MYRIDDIVRKFQKRKIPYLVNPNLTVLDGEEHITLETLQPLRDYMTTAQLERFGDYMVHKKPSHPFTTKEVKELQYMREAIMETRRQFQAELLKGKDKENE